MLTYADVCYIGKELASSSLHGVCHLYSIRQNTSAYVLAYIAYVRIRQNTSAYVSIDGVCASELSI